MDWKPKNEDIKILRDVKKDGRKQMQRFEKTLRKKINIYKP